MDKQLIYYTVTWLDNCIWIDTEKKFFKSFADAIKYIKKSVQNTKEVDEQTKQYIFENLIEEEWNCDCYSIDTILFCDI